jgi:hypothetical protein
MLVDVMKWSRTRVGSSTNRRQTGGIVAGAKFFGQREFG